MSKYVEKSRKLFAITIQENDQSCFSGSKSIIDYMKSQYKILLSSLSDQMLQTSENSFVSEKQLIFPKLITTFKGPSWTTKIAQSSLKTYMSILGKIFTVLYEAVMKGFCLKMRCFMIISFFPWTFTKDSL